MAAVLNSNENRNWLARMRQGLRRKFDFAFELGKFLVPFGLLVLEKHNYFESLSESKWPEPVKSFVIYSVVFIFLMAPLKIIKRVLEIGLDAYKLEIAQAEHEQKLEADRKELLRIDEDYHSQGKIINAAVKRAFMAGLTILPYPLLVWAINYYFKQEGYGSDYLMSLMMSVVIVAMVFFVKDIVSKDMVRRSPNQ